MTDATTGKETRFGLARMTPPHYVADPYTAVEAELIAIIARELRATAFPALREVDVEICAGVVILWGRVPSYYQKQLAQSVAQRVEGVRAIANGLEVVCRR